MAMHLNNIDRDKIRKQGRWSSDTFLMYIHEQISAFSSGLASKMSTEIGWHNIDGPTLTAPRAHHTKHSNISFYLSVGFLVSTKPWK